MDPLSATGVAVAGAFGLTWLVSLALRDASVVDLLWGLGFGLLAWVAWWAGPREGPSRLLLPALATVWGLRLSLYLAYRNWGRGEDPRYVALRRRYPPFWLNSLWIVFGLQATLQWLIALPLVTVQRGPVILGPLVVAGGALWAVGLAVESLADWQLARFRARAENAGRVLDRGLWRYTRHPNYLGDFLVWWGLFLVAVAQGAPWWTVLSPLLMSGLLLKVSGVPLLESRLRRTRPAYAEYARKTPAFFPWWPAGEPT